MSVAHRAPGLRCCSRSCLQGRGRGCPDRRRRRGGRPASWRQISSEDKQTHTGWQIIKASFKFFTSRIVRGTSFPASTETLETAQSSYIWGKQLKSLGFYELPSVFMHVLYIFKPPVFCCNKDCIKKSRLDPASINEQKFWDLLFNLKGVQLWVRMCLGLLDHDQDRGIESYHIF